MKILLTGSSGRIGRAIHRRLCSEHEVVGYDSAPSSTTDIVASLQDTPRLEQALRGAGAVIHTAALHAPHVGHADDSLFEAVNVVCTQTLARLCLEHGVGQFVFTSTTALYGAASSVPGRAAWITEETTPEPRTVYHTTKLRGEAALQAAARSGSLAVAVIRMSRCFPEPAPLMAAYRLHRGIDARDVADAHACALSTVCSGFRRFIVSGATPFLPADAALLHDDAAAVIERRAPALAEAFARRGWPLPRSIDRVYSPAAAQADLGWRPAYGFDEVLAELDRRSAEVLPSACRARRADD